MQYRLGMLRIKSRYRGIAEIDLRDLIPGASSTGGKGQEGSAATNGLDRGNSLVVTDGCCFPPVGIDPLMRNRKWFHPLDQS
ncbi:MAG: hypothetical protein ABSC48_11190 [Terracidiphilus sp.]|jgi:hypothetical protein